MFCFHCFTSAVDITPEMSPTQLILYSAAAEAEIFYTFWKELSNRFLLSLPVPGSLLVMNVNWQNGAVTEPFNATFFDENNLSLLLWIRIILENCASKWETWHRGSVSGAIDILSWLQTWKMCRRKSGPKICAQREIIWDHFEVKFLKYTLWQDVTCALP